jgi:hypothetical protein
MISPKDIYIKAGYGPKTQDLINKEVRNKFPNYSFPNLKYPLSPNDIIAFAYLYKKLNFKAKFERSPEPSFSFNGKTVASFYAT